MAFVSKDLVKSLSICVVFPFAFIFSHAQLYFPFLDVSEASIYLLKYTLYGLICWTLLFMLSKRVDKAGILTCFLLAVNFFFSSAHSGIKDIFGDLFITRYRVILPSIVLVFGVLLWNVTRSQRNFGKAVGYVLTVLLIFISIDLVRIIYKTAFPTTSGTVKLDNAPDSFLPCDTCTRRDIYFLVFDEFASSSSLKQQFGFRNDFIDSFLVKEGFQVLSQSRSNYNWTQFSLGSMLNMAYLHIPDKTSLVYEDYMAVTNLIKHANLFDFFRSKGYSILNYTGFDIKGANPPIPYEVAPDMIYTMSSNTFFNTVDKDIGWNFRRNSNDTSYMNFRIENSIRYHQQAKQGIIDAANSPSTAPKFVYGHFFISHRPLFLDSLGNRRKASAVMSDTSRKQVIDAYCSNLRNVNKEIESLVSTIKKGTNEESIIIVMGDHGFRSFDVSQDTCSYFQNFNAIYLPGHKRVQVSDSLTGVNQFRWLLNQCYGQQFPLLKDDVYFLIDKP